MPQTIVVRTQVEQNKIDAEKGLFFIYFFSFCILLAISLGIGIFLKEAFRLADKTIFWIIIALWAIVIFSIIKIKKMISAKKASNKYWQRIGYLPNWAYKKMKRKHSHIVNGEHYVYKKEGNKCYRKKK